MNKKGTFRLSFAKLRNVDWEPASWIFDIGKLAEKKLPNLRGGQLFAYLFRRFGYPNFGWDSRKDLACYLFSTPDPDVILRITPYMGGDCPDGRPGARHMFGAYIAETLRDEEESVRLQSGHGAWVKTERGQQCAQALETALLDLLRPVYLDDVPINCLGSLRDKDLKTLPRQVYPFAGAGIAAPEALFAQPERYSEFYEAIIALGKGSFALGMRKVIALSKDTAK